MAAMLLVAPHNIRQVARRNFYRSAQESGIARRDSAIYGACGRKGGAAMARGVNAFR